MVWTFVRMAVALALAAATFAAREATAQEMQPLPPAQPGAGATAGASPQKPAAAAPSKAGGGDAALRQRVEQLEEQLVDLQVVIGTLESLARSGATATAAAAPAPTGYGGADSGRLDALETQVRALASQVEQLSTEVRSGPRSDAGPPPATGYASSNNTYAPPAAGESFGSTTVTSDPLDPIGGLIENHAANTTAGPSTGTLQPDAYQPGASQQPPAALPPAGGPQADSGGAKALYEQAYGNLLRQDYGAAQAGFTEFLRKYPSDTLAPDALYWLGETHYVQRNYTEAAEAFDLVTSSFASSAKAPEAQLKRGMALAQVGKKAEACSAFRQLGTRFPNARPVVKTKADSERQRVGCT